MGLAKISQNSADALRDLLDAPPPPGLSTVHTTEEPDRRFPVIMGKVRTPIVPKDSIGGGGRHSAAGQFSAIATTATHPIDDAEIREPVTGVTAQTFTVAEDKTSGAVAGTRIAIDGSTANDQWYELSTDPTYAAAADETTFTVVEDVPDLTADGELCLPSAWIPDTKSNVYTASAHSPVAAFAGDHVAFAQIHGEYVPIAGPLTIYGYLNDDIQAATVTSDGRLQVAVETVKIWAFDADGVWSNTGIERTVTNLWENVVIYQDTLISAQRMNNRWIITSAACNPTGIDLDL